MNIVLFDEEEIMLPLAFSDERAEHILNVLRKHKGDSFDAGVINGMAGTALITAIDREEKKIYSTFTARDNGKPLYPVRVIIGFPRPIQLKRVFRDMAGLGVSEIHLAGTELGEKSYMRSTIFVRGNGDKRSAAEKMLVDGSAQAKSTRVPKLFLHNNVKTCLEKIAASSDAFRAALDNAAPETSLIQALGGLAGIAKDVGKNTLPMVLSETKLVSENDVNVIFASEGGMGATECALGGRLSPSVIIAIGNERGWTDNEREFFKCAGFLLCGMGKRVLRTETASCAAVSLVLGAMGVLED
ncbi:MAG: 16S rRNA (uracil(1498)-N(3))-methyltransferase [Treponemataceae bacterium]|nr:MAG: 16S rRNA (uracil(1498)-N(3))-methyltransferase [Treponemataceae bacterium]